MAWERGYYYRSHKEGGRVIREYVGRGRVAELAAQLDAIERERREDERAALRAERAELSDLDAVLEQVCQEVELLARAALVAAGFRQHKRGEWRKRRDNPKPAEPERADGPEGRAGVSGPRRAR
jgi:hypothetical protein